MGAWPGPWVLWEWGRVSFWKWEGIPDPHPAPTGPRAPLRTYIKEELGRALGAARQDLLEQMRGSEQRLGARLAQLEQGPGPHPRGRKK